MYIGQCELWHERTNASNVVQPGHRNEDFETKKTKWKSCAQRNCMSAAIKQFVLDWCWLCSLYSLYIVHTLQLHNSHAKTSWLNIHSSADRMARKIHIYTTQTLNCVFATVATHLQVMYLLPRKSSNTIWQASYFILPASASNYYPCCVNYLQSYHKFNGICPLSIHATHYIYIFHWIFNAIRLNMRLWCYHVGDVLSNCHRSICANIYSIFNLPFSIKSLTFVFIVFIHMVIFRYSKTHSSSRSFFVHYSVFLFHAFQSSDGFKNISSKDVHNVYTLVVSNGCRILSNAPAFNAAYFHDHVAKNKPIKPPSYVLSP